MLHGESRLDSATFDAPRWSRLERLFAAAEPLPAAARLDLLDATFAARPDGELRGELEELLQAADVGHDRVDGAISGGLASFAAEPPPPRLGPYLVRGEIGRGGMATVYAAERGDREFERTVAIKVLRRGMDTADIVRRLCRERQILANLDHPNIARLLDGGSTEDGRPYVVMEHIAGLPIDRFCEGRQLDLAKRLALFRQICGAVHHAHRNLVLHRDIKPSNILVTAEGTPKLLDFGIAKALVGDGGDGEPEPTLTGQRWLTPEWASPEQLRGEPLSTASDVYSLRLLLYLLVTGKRQPAGAAPQDPGRGDDLDLIVLAALRQEPGRRYSSAEQLAEDLRRYLENLPVLARKDTFGYRAGKFVRRHRTALAAAGATFLILAAAALFAFGQARVAREQRGQAEANLARAEAVAGFLGDLFEGAEPAASRGRDLTARDLLDRGAERMRTRLHEDASLRADLLGTLGRVYQKLALYDDAAALLEEAAALRGPSGAAAAASRADLAALAFQRGRLGEAERLAGLALAGLRESGAPRAAQAPCLKILADVAASHHRNEEAERLYGEALAARLAGGEGESDEVLALRDRIGELYYRRGENERAAKVFAASIAARRQSLEKDHPALATALNDLAATELAAGRGEAALVLMKEAFEIRRRVFGEDHIELALGLNNLAAVEGQVGRLDDALAHLEQGLAIAREVHRGEPHPEVAGMLHNLGLLHQRRGEAAAGARFAEALAMQQRIFPAGHPQVAEAQRSLDELAATPRRRENKGRTAKSG